MKKSIYKDAYEEYLQYCKEHNKVPYKLNTLTKLVNQIEGAWFLPIQEKIKLWYEKELFKKRVDNGPYKYKEEREFYNNYKGEKKSLSRFIQDIKRGIPKQEAIKKQRGDKIKYYRENIDKAKVDYPCFVRRVKLGWDLEQALTTPKKNTWKKTQTFTS